MRFPAYRRGLLLLTSKTTFMLKPVVLTLASLPLLLVSCKKDDQTLTGQSNLERPVKRDMEAPVVAIVNPLNGTAVWDTYLSVRASDDVGIKKIEIFEDGLLIQSWESSEHGKPVMNWTNTYFYNPGIWDIRILKAVATDWSGKTSQHEITVYKLISCCPPPPAP